ncbi:MAG: substrate-binding domain-containing protein [Pirellulales bacterium]|nr:substrate-binding domain-containing protein [Pirellulales bacterium]
MAIERENTNESTKRESAAVLALADRIVADIRGRQMSVGDRYLTRDETQRTFGASTGLTNRALRWLAMENVLDRRQRSGTFIGPNAPVQSPARVRTIHVLLPADRRDVFGYPFDIAVRALCKEIPDASVQFSFVPERNEVEYAKELISASQMTGQCYGVVSISGTHELNAYLAQTHVAAVAQSSYVLDAGAIPTVDLDLHEGGRLLAEYLVRQGHRRIALIHAAQPRQGDNEFFDGISEAMTAAELPHNGLIYRFVPPGVETIAAETHRLLDSEDPPTAFIGRVGSIAKVIADAVATRDMRVPDDVEITFIDHATSTAERSPHPHVCPEPTFEETIAIIAKMLRDLVENKKLKSRRILVPVRFHARKSHAHETTQERHKEP